MRNVFVSNSHRLDPEDVDDFHKGFGSNFGCENNYILPLSRKSSLTIILI